MMGFYETFQLSHKNAKYDHVPAAAYVRAEQWQGSY